MVGQRFVELCADKLKARGASDRVEVVSFCEERLAAYNRVRLTSWFETRDADDLSLVGSYKESPKGEWYASEARPNCKVRVGELATGLDVAAKTVACGDELVKYDKCVLATGSYPFVPPIPGKDLPGVFVYRTIDDLEALVAYQKAHGIETAVVIGGGLLGLEAAKAMHDLGLKTHVLEYAPILMCRQIDQGGHDALVGMVEDLGLEVHCDARTKAFEADADGRVAKITFETEGWADLDVGIIVVSAGIRPRDEVARDAVDCHERGGVVVSDTLQTSDADVYAVGEVALHGGMIYGLVAPGYAMAEVAADHLLADLLDAPVEDAKTFEGADMSTKLKLLGCDVANFGAPTGDEALVWEDKLSRTYRKLFFEKKDEGWALSGGILVGDADDYAELLALSKAGTIVEEPAALLAPLKVRGSGVVEVDDADPSKQICSCNAVSQGDLATFIQTSGAECSFAEIKKCTKAGAGCGGCEPDVKKILKTELEKLGAAVDNSLCAHFAYSRPELVAKLRLDQENFKSFDEVIKAHGVGDGCEVCKPAVASILASLHNDKVLDGDRAALQDTNDRSLANMQRGGSYSVVPRVPGGEIRPEQLIVLGEVAQKFDLYSKITGAQRVDLFGAAKSDLPAIWADLGKVGFESGHAYGKALRTVKSCVGSSWCRFGMQNSVDFAIQVENRYKGLRGPHKFKSAVSGCTRECAEAQSKDFGMIATEHGYDLYVAGNGGLNPRLGALLASGIDEATTLKYIDRFLMYYILTGERLERTAPWFERLAANDDARLKALQDIIIDDSLGIVDELDRRMEHHLATYHDEWAEVVENPEKFAHLFKQFANTDETQSADEMIEFVETRGQRRPADWPQDGAPQTNWRPPSLEVFGRSEHSWQDFGPADAFAPNLGTAVLYGRTQLAVFKLKDGSVFATQNMCPHKQAFVLAQGIASDGETPKVACPLHKKQFDLRDGKEINGGDLEIVTFAARIDGGRMMLNMPPRDEVDAVLATDKLRVCSEAPVQEPVFSR